ncbi:EAL domain-containing protein [Sphingosinicella ginsenosidimutans]|uniref:EAL domain-containing protein n=1 Tax=Allosphingosinicella ginsenosidimutans TaxID=1176539 RepID=A0A5C6TRP3_9SPHN|nr:EAL domain-containing protein [Sphingosinicella ginsenosidimutans]TXC62860.1 EAL domain-containing protein [Sphingosinicella ginsenosidimutans]
MPNAVLSPDVDQFGETAEAPAGALPYDAGDRLRAAHLHRRQIEGRALFAGPLAVTASLAALITAWAMIGSVPHNVVFGWAALVTIANFVSCQRAMAAPAHGAGRSAGARATWLAVVEAMGLAALWSALPCYAFATEPAEVQVVIGGAMAAMTGAAIALAATPAAAIAWIGTLTAFFCVAFYFGSAHLDPKIAATFVLISGASAFSVARLTRWTYAQLKAVATAATEAESVRSLLDEYEQRGVGWLWQLDSENRVVYISSRMPALLGRSASQLVGHSLPAALGGSSALGRALLSRQPFANLEMELKTRSGTRWISLAGDPIVDAAGRFQGYRGVGQDVTEVKKNQERLTNLANHDLLSGLPNRGRVRQLLAEALSGAAGVETACAIMFLDLDGFKPVNDTFGHPKGDAVLKSVAKRLRKVVGGGGHVGRMGGDEFAIVIKDASSRQMVEALAGRVIEAVAEPYNLDKAEIRIGVSIGCAFGPADGRSVDDLIQKADLALYQAKAQGRGTCCFFSAALQNEMEDRLRLEQDLKAGIGAGQLRLLYQPLINAADQSLMGFEALVRWHHPVRGMIPPNAFIPLAEESGLIVELGEWVIEEACRAAACWPDTITVAVNISAKQLTSAALPNMIADALGRHRMPPNRLELEVTESIFMSDSPHALDVLKRLRALGVGIALDDFGTGYSSLGYLNKAVFHKLKIDGSFVREAGANRETVAIIQSIVQLARSFRMTITAEGVETADDFTRMRDLGCHQIQGYLFGRPMDFERATALVQGTMQRRLRA